MAAPCLRGFASGLVTTRVSRAATEPPLQFSTTIGTSPSQVFRPFHRESFTHPSGSQLLSPVYITDSCYSPPCVLVIPRSPEAVAHDCRAVATRIERLSENYFDAKDQ